MQDANAHATNRHEVQRVYFSPQPNAQAVDWVAIQDRDCPPA